MLDVIVVLGIIAAAIFLVGLVLGAIRAFSDTTEDDPQAEGDGHYGSTAAIAVVLSALVIALAGVSPIFIYLGPLLAIGTATGVGLAFLIEIYRPKPSR